MPLRCGIKATWAERPGSGTRPLRRTPPGVGVERRHRGQQLLRVGVRRPLEELGRRGHFHKAPLVHHAHAPAADSGPLVPAPRTMENNHSLGEDCKMPNFRQFVRETPPLAWGRLGHIPHVGCVRGNTPTRVGKTRPRGHDGHRGADGPRGGSRPLGRLDVFWAPAASRASLESTASALGVLRPPTAPEASHAAPRAAPGAPVASAAARVTRGIGIHSIPPGTPDPHAYIDRFHRTYREEVLDAYLLESLEEVRVVSERWLVTSNRERPHDSVGEFPPLMFLQRPSSPGQSPY